MTVLLQVYGAGMAFLVVAVIAALFGFGIVSDDDPLAAKLGAGFFLFAAIAAFGWAWLNRSRTTPDPRRRGPRERSDQPWTVFKREG